MEKVKVSREVANAIEYLLKSASYMDDKGRILSSHSSSNFNWRYDTPANGLNGVSVMKLAEILVNGYEVEETPEEKLVREYQEGLQIGAGHRTHANAIKFTLDTLGIEIEGINV